MNIWRFPVMLLAVSLCTPVFAAETNTKPEVIAYDLKGVLNYLSNALAIHDEIPTLEESKLIGRDVDDAQSDMSALIDEVIGMLDSEAIIRLRSTYRKLEAKIEKENDKLVEYKSDRVIAPLDGTSMISRVTPTNALKSIVASTKGDYDQLITATENNVKAYQQDLTSVKEELRLALAEVGVSLDSDQLETLMGSVVGEDIISMSVVFRTVKDLTDQLEQLTSETAESLEHSKKYYGMVVILYRIVTTMQDQFIDKVTGTYLPKLAAYKADAKATILESDQLIKNGVNVAILKANIHANNLTIEVINLYASMLEKQRQKVEKARDIASKESLVADNTYHTVSLSSAVVSMIREGRSTFETLMGIQMPDIRVFKNDEIKSEFIKLTAKMKST
jgi:hypothetical protein